MIGLIEKTLERLGLIDPVTRDDIINASIEDKARETDKAVEALNTALHKRKETNGALRSSIRMAERQTSSFADFERLVAAREKK